MYHIHEHGSGRGLYMPPHVRAQLLVSGARVRLSHTNKVGSRARPVRAAPAQTQRTGPGWPVYALQARIQMTGKTWPVIYHSVLRHLMQRTAARTAALDAAHCSAGPRVRTRTASYDRGILQHLMRRTAALGQRAAAPNRGSGHVLQHLILHQLIITCRGTQAA